MKKRKSNNAAYAILSSHDEKTRLCHLTKERRKKHCAFRTLNLNHKKKIRNTMNLNPYIRSENTTCIKSSLQTTMMMSKKPSKIASKSDAC